MSTRASRLEPVKSYIASQIVPLSVLVLIVAIASILSPVFFTAVNISNLFLQVSFNMIISMGMYMAILSGGVDLSVGSMTVVCAVLVAGLMNVFEPMYGMAGLWLAILLAVLAGTSMGTVNGLVVSKLKVAPFIATLGMMSLARGIALWYTGALTIGIRDLSSFDFFSELANGRLLAVGQFAGIPIPAVIWVVFVGISFFIVRYTVLGRVMFAIGGNEEAARLSGIRTSRYRVFPYAFSGFCCGIAGVLLTSRLGIGSHMSGEGWELTSMAAVVIGGTKFGGGEGHIGGVVIGVFILGVINNIMNLMNVPAHPQLMFTGAIIIAAVVLSSVKLKR